MIPSTQGKNDTNPSNNSLNSASGDWIICDSKSRPGQKYYFNVKTRKSVWNLSDVEITSSEYFMHLCETLYICTLYYRLVDRVYFNTTYPYLKDLKLSCAKEHTEIINSILDNIPEPRGPPTMNPSQNASRINNQMFNICGLINSGTNNNVWATHPTVAQAPQFYLVPAIAPLVHPAVPEVNQNRMQAYQNVATLPPRDMNRNQMFAFQNTFSLLNQNVPNNAVHNNNNTRSVSRRITNNQSSSQHNIDLRQKLTRKRKLSEPYGQVEPIDHNHGSYSANNSIAESEVTEDTQSTSIADFLNSGNCFIVVDTDAILNDFVFFDNLIDDDSNFHLVIPHHVMKELKDNACHNGDARVRRVVRFLSEKIESHLVNLGKEIDEQSVPSNTDKIYITCYQFAEGNNKIILVSNNIETQKYKIYNEHIQILTVLRLKEIISKIKFKASPRFASPTRAIKIIVPNEAETSTKINNESEGSITKHINSPSISSSSLPLKQTVDFAVQTNIDENHITERNNTLITETVDTVDSKSSSYIGNNISQSNIVKKREIKLNRSTSVKKVNNEEPVIKEKKKQFRWSKRRAKIDSNLSQNTQTCDVTVETNPVDINDINQTAISTESLCVNQSISTPNKMTFQSYIQSNASANKDNSLPELSNVQVTRGAPSNTNARLDVSPAKPQAINTAKPICNLSDSQTTTDKMKSVTFRNCHMYEIVNQSMEEALKTRCDEWISRFVQIMEEILKEKLQEDPPFESKDFPPPWNLHEAAKCIIKKFSDYFNVVDAANKLSFVLYKLSDSKGKIQMSIQPSEYMEMYSYGVYLIETLQDVSENEDLEIASECMNKLLYDIYNANLESSQNDIFCDDFEETAVEGSVSTEEPEAQLKSPIPSQVASNFSSPNKCVTKPQPSPRKEVIASYKLRSTTKKQEVEEKESTIKSPVNKSAFMSCLKLTTSPKTPRTPSSIESSFKSYSTNTHSRVSSITRTIRNSPKSADKVPLSVQTPKANSPQKQTVNQTNESTDNTIEGKKKENPDNTIEGKKKENTGNAIEGKKKENTGYTIEVKKNYNTDNTIVGKKNEDTDNTIEGKKKENTVNTIEGKKKVNTGNTIEGKINENTGNTIERKKNNNTDNTIEGKKKENTGNTTEGKKNYNTGNTIEGKKNHNTDNTTEGKKNYNTGNTIEGKKNHNTDNTTEGKKNYNTGNTIEGKKNYNTVNTIEGKKNHNANNTIEENTVSPTVTQKVIRNFQICAEFEERLNKARSLLELDEHTEEDNSENEYYYDYEYFEPNFDQVLNNPLVNVWNANGASYEGIHNINCNNNYKRFMQSFLGGLTKTYANVKLLCDELIKNRSSPNHYKNSQLTCKAVKAYVTMDQIKNSLNNIINRDTNAETSFVTLLKEANIEVISDEVCLQYRDAVTKFKHQADSFIKLLKLLLTK